MKIKVAALLLSLLVVTGSDLWSKRWAETSLGTISHPLPFPVGESDAGKTLDQFVEKRLPGLSAAERKKTIARDIRFLQKRTIDLKKPFPERQHVYVFHRKSLDESPRYVFRLHSTMLHLVFTRWMGLDAAESRSRLKKLSQSQTAKKFLLERIFELSESDVAEVAKNFCFVNRNLVVRPDRKLVKGDLIVLRAKNIEVISGFWRFTYAENSGAAWSFLADAPAKFRIMFFTTVSIIAIIVILFIYFRLDTTGGPVVWAFAVIVGGALGNFVDRLRYNYVVDFIQWHWADKAHWPTFNIADVAIVIGVALLIIDMLFNKQSVLFAKPEAEKKTAKA